MKNNFIVLLVGASGSGKTTLANSLNNLFGWKSINSYTTRCKRHPDETGHIFVTDNEFDQILLKEGAVAYTEYASSRYCATPQQVEDAQIYVIDIPGVEYFKSHYKGNKKVITVLLNLPENVRKERLLTRGDGDDGVNKRLETDRIEFSKERITSIHPNLVVDKDYSKETLVALVHWFVCDAMDKAEDSSLNDEAVPETATTRTTDPEDVTADDTAKKEETEDGNEPEADENEDDEEFDDDAFDILSKLSSESLMRCLYAELCPKDKAVGMHDDVADLALEYRLNLSDCGYHDSIALTTPVWLLLSSTASDFVSKTADMYIDGTLHNLAFENMKRDGRIVFRSLAGILSRTLLPEEYKVGGTSVYALYSQNGDINTPALILDSDILKVIRQNKLFADGFYILPSSIHELILVPKGRVSVADLTAMVHDINLELVKPEERLSNHIYEIIDGNLKIAGS